MAYFTRRNSADNILPHGIKKLNCSILWLVLLSLFLLPANGFCQNKIHILVLHSYHQGLEWTDSEDAGINSIIKTSPQKIELHTEYLDTKRISNQKHYENLFELIKNKYANIDFKVIICSDDNAFNFVQNNYGSLFAGVPVVFCGVNYFKESQLKINRDVVTGVVEAFDIPNTLRIALKLHPGATKVFVINDRTTTGLANRKILTGILPEFQDRAEFEFLEDFDMSGLLEKVHSLPPQSIILLMSFNRDRAGQVFDYNESVSLISQAANVPIYGVWDFYLGKGIVGGMLTSGLDQGRIAAQMALRIIAGEDARNIPVVKKSPNRYMFDYRQLKRFGIALKDLPDGAMIKYQPATFYQLHPMLTWGAGGGFAALSVIIVLLLVHIRVRRHAEKALGESEERFRTLYESNPSMYFTVSMEGSILSVNPFGAEQLGYSEEELIGRPVLELFSLDDREAMSQKFAGCLNKPGDVFRYELRKVHKDGTILWVREAIRAVNGSEGDQPLVLIVSENITKRKQAEEALRKSEWFLHNIVENIPATIFVRDARDLRFVLLNKMFEDLFGYSREEMLGKSVFDYFPQHEAEFFQEKDRQVLNGKCLIDIPEESAQTKHLGERILHTKKIPILDEQGEPQFLLGIAEDITERKKDEAERIRLATAIDQLAEAVLIVDTDWFICYVNPAFERMSGYEKTEIIGRPVSSLKNDHENAAHNEKMRDTLAHGYGWSGRTIGIRKDGTRYEAEITASPIRDSSGTIINYVTIHRDITQEVKLQKILRQTQKTEAIGTLAGGIAHDFNNILSAIIGHTEMAKHKLPGESPAQHNLQQVLRAGSRATELVKQILTYGRQRDQEKKPVQIAQCVEEALKLLRPSLPTTIEIQQSLKIPSERSTVLADQTEIHQVLMNLCTNASHAMHDTGGTLSIELSEVFVDKFFAARHPDLKVASYICLTVSDTGAGMNTAVLERIFDPYFTTKKLGEGTGLGLAVVQGIIKSCGGTITVYSEPGKGTSFHVFLPRIEQDVPVQIEEEEILPTGTESILLVDDEKILVELGQEMFESLGYSVTTRTDSSEALELFSATPQAFDLVITDMTMPGMTGTELAKQLLALRSNQPVILCTGFSELLNGKQADQIGISEIVMKPYVLSEMAKIIRRVLERHGPQIQ